LVDGTIRVQIDIDPPHRAAFLAAFSDIDCGVALARLAPAVAASTLAVGPPVPANEDRAAAGPLCRLAAIWCKDIEFQDWLADNYGGLFNAGPDGEDLEESAARAVRSLCGVTSRRELDVYLEAKAAFDLNVRWPFQEHLSLLPRARGDGD
jgi:hypothetical protein